MPSPLKSLLLLLFISCTAIGGCAESRTPEEYLATAQDYLDRGELKPALIELKNALKSAPDNALARRLLGELYLNLGDGASAQKELERATVLGVNPGFTTPLLARALLLQQDYEGVLAINPFQSDLQPDGKASIHASRGMALIATKKLDEADKEFEAGLTHNAESPEVLTSMAWLAVSRQQLEQARGLLEQVFESNADYAEAWALLGNIERVDGNLEAALEAYKMSAANRYANNWDVLNQISINIALGNHDVARSEIALQREQGASSYLLDYLEGLLYYQENNFTEARPLFEQVTQVAPEHIRSLFYAGATNLQQENHEQARDYLNRFNTRNPGYSPALKMLAWLALQNEDYEAAQRYIRPVIAQQPDDVVSLNMMSSALIGDNKTVEGVEILQQIVELNPESADARMKLGVGMIMEGDMQSGMQELEASRELDPGVLQTSVTIIFTYLKNNEPTKALEAALRLQASHPDSVVANAALGTVYLTMGENDNATQSFHDTLSLEAGNITANSGLASLAAQAGKQDEAKNYYRKILESAPGNLNTSMNLAYLSALDGSVDEMQTVLEKAIEIHPGVLLPRLALARYYMEQGNYPRVIELLLPVRQSANGNFAYLKMLSEAQYRTGDFVKARSNLDALLKVAPDNASVHYLLALTLKKLDDKQGARDELLRVLELDPTHVGARILLIEVQIANGDPVSARRNLEIWQTQSGETAELLILQGRLAHSIGDNASAVSYYRKAFGLKETNINLLKLEAATWDAGDQQAAIDLLKSWLDRFQADQLANARLASRYVATGKESDAITVYTGLVEQNPENAGFLNDLAWLLRESDPGKAQTYAEKAYALQPNSPVVMDTLALIVSKSDPSRARLLIREARSQNPKNPAYRYHQALILVHADEPDQAIKILEKLLGETTDFPEVEDARQLLKKLKG